MNAVEHSIIPGRFSASIGGYMGASYSVELHGDTLSYTASNFHYADPEHTSVRPTARQWRAFRRVLDEFNIWDWHSDYPNPGILDGTGWSLDIAYADHALTTQGDNNYPDSSGNPNGKPSPTRAFNRYLAAVKKLTGKSFQ